MFGISRALLEPLPFPPLYQLDLLWCEVEKVATVNPPIKQSFSPLLYAVTLKNLALCEKLVGLGAEVNAINQGFTSLICAAKHGEWDIVIFFIKQGANLESYDLEGLTIFHLAALAGKIDVCSLLLEKKIPVDFMTFSHPGRLGTRWTPLFFAVLKNDVEMVSFLINKGAFVNLLDIHENPSIFYALINKSKLVIQLFSKSRVNLTYQSLKALLLTSIESDDIEQFELFLSMGIDVNIGYLKETPLTLAISLDKERFVEKLLANPNTSAIQRNSNDESPLDKAIICGRWSCFGMLLKKRAVAHSWNSAMTTPLLRVISEEKVNAMPSDMYHTLLKKDKGLTQCIINYRLLGLRFDLSGSPFDDLGRNVTFPAILDSIEAFNSIYSSNEEIKEIYLILNNALKILQSSILKIDSPSHYSYLIRQDFPVIIPLHISNLVTCMAVYKKQGLLFKCDRRTALDQGISIYALPDFNEIPNILEFLFQKMIAKDEKSLSVDFFYQEMDRALNLKLLKRIQLKNKAQGNRCWSAAKDGYLCSLILAFLSTNTPLEESIAASLKIYKTWKNFDFSYGLMQVNKERLGSYSKFFDLETAYKEIYQRCASQGRFAIVDYLQSINPFLKTDVNAIFNILDKKSESKALSIIQEWIKRQPSIDLNARNREGSTLLHEAVKKNKSSIVSFFLQCGANPNLDDHNGVSPLKSAASNGHLEICRALINGKVCVKKLFSDEWFLLELSFKYPDIFGMQRNCLLYSLISFNRYRNFISKFGFLEAFRRFCLVPQE